MLKNYFNTAFRTLKKNRAYTFINVFGLALGLGCSLVIFKVILHELSFDKHQAHYENIYRVSNKSIYSDREEFGSGTPHPVGTAVRADIADVVAVTRTYFTGGDQLNYTKSNGEIEKLLVDDGIAFVESDFFKIFTTEWVAGDQNTALTTPNTVVLSRTAARTMFQLPEGQEASAMGKIVNYKNDFTVVGIVEDLPETTNLPFDYFFEYDGLQYSNSYYDDGTQWNSTSSGTNTYVLLTPEQDISAINEQLVDMVLKYLGKEATETRVYFLQSLADLHFNKEIGSYAEMVSIKFLYALGIIGLFLILTASINFINLATAQAANRAKEIGVRKAIGSSSPQLIVQFMFEITMITFTAMIVSFAIAELMFIFMEETIGYRLYLNLLSTPLTIVFSLSLLVIVSFISGLYPSVLLARMNTIQALKSKLSNNKTSGFSLRKGLVVLQFSISQFLIIGTLIVSAQMDFFSNAELGFEKDAIINSYLPDQDEVKSDRFRNAMVSSPAISEVSFMLSQPTGSNNSHSNFDYEPLNSEISYHGNFKAVDEYYFDMFDLELLAGRKLRKSDSTNVIIINRKIANLIGFEGRYDEAVGEILKTGWNGNKKIIGVMENFHTNALDEPIDYVILIRHPRIFYSMSFKLASNTNIDPAINHFKKVWEDVYPEYVIDYDFLDEEIASRYETEKRTGMLMRIFAVISILIGCLGLYGLISFIAINRTKEIGVRKVLGASVFSILGMFSKEIVLLTGIAFVVAAPLAYYFSGQWLETYAYSIDLGIKYFAVAFTLTMCIALITIAHRSITTATINPARTLKDE